MRWNEARALGILHYANQAFKSGWSILPGCCSPCAPTWGERPQQSKHAFSTMQPPFVGSWDCRAALHMLVFASQPGEKASQNQPFVQKIAPRSLPVCRTRQSRLVISLKISGCFVFEHHHRKFQSFVQSAAKATCRDHPSTRQLHWDLRFQQC